MKLRRVTKGTRRGINIGFYQLHSLSLQIFHFSLKNDEKINNLVFTYLFKKARRRKHRNKKHRGWKDEDDNENNGADKLVEDHISVRIEEEKGITI